MLSARLFQRQISPCNGLTTARETNLTTARTALLDREAMVATFAAAGAHLRGTYKDVAIQLLSGAKKINSSCVFFFVPG